MIISFSVFFISLSRPLPPFCYRATPSRHEASAPSRDISWQHRDMADRNLNRPFRTISFSINHREGISFPYGNGIPLRIASYFFILCNERGGYCVTVMMFSFYKIWADFKDTLHHTKYYNTQFKKLYWLNGENCSQQEPVIPEATDIPLGYEGTDLNQTVLNKLLQMADVEVSLEFLS